MSREGWELSGWLLFGGSAVAFLISSLRTGDVVDVMASVLFLLGVIAFLVPLLRR